MEKQSRQAALRDTFRFFTTGIWRIRTDGLPHFKALGIRLLRIGILSVQGFEKHNCMFRASALTFYSLLSIVPVLAMAFGVAKGFGFEKALETELLEGFSEQREVILRATEFADALLQNTKGGLIAGIGVLLLFWAIIRMLGNIENAFNQIWGVPKARSLTKKITDYLSAMIVCPVLFLVSSTATVVIASQVRLVVERISLLGPVGTMILHLLQGLPYAVTWILFTFIYMFMPNRKIRFTSALFAGIAGGTLFQIFQWVYVAFQIGVAKYNAIYGSFAALPLFLLWLQISWMVVLFGGEISCAHETEKTYEFAPDLDQVSESFLRLVSLRVVHLLVERFTKGEKPLSDAQIAAALDLPIRLAWKVLHRLVASGVLSEICDGRDGNPTYQPAQDVDTFTVKFVLERLDEYGADTIPLKKTPEIEKLSQCLADFEKAIQNSPANLLLKEI